MSAPLSLSNTVVPDIELPVEPQMPGAHMIDQDFNDSANPLWSLYGKVVKEYDKATLDDITSGMDGLLIFVRSISPALPLLRASSYLWTDAS